VRNKKKIMRTKNEKLRIVAGIQRKVAAGMTLSGACRSYGVAPVSYSDWAAGKKLEMLGYHANGNGHARKKSTTPTNGHANGNGQETGTRMGSTWMPTPSGCARCSA